MAEEVVDAPVETGEVTSDDKLWSLLCWLLWPEPLTPSYSIFSASTPGPTTEP